MEKEDRDMAALSQSGLLRDRLASAYVLKNANFQRSARMYQ